MTKRTSILVLGAGELGLSVLRSLARRNAQFSSIDLTVLLRPATINSRDLVKRKDIAEIASLGVKILPGDLAADSATDLSALFAGFDTVIGCTGFVSGRNIQLKIAHAVLNAAVRRYFPWQFGVDYDVIGRGGAQDLFDEQLDVRELLKSQNRTNWVIVSTGMFTSFLFDPSFGVVDLAENVVRALGSWDNSVTVTTAEDIGNLTAEILFTEPQINNSIVYTAGDTVTYAEVADIVESVLQRKVQREEWTVPKLKDDLSKDPQDSLKKYRVVFAEGRGVSWDIGTSFNGQRGIKVVNAAQWAAANLRGEDTTSKGAKYRQHLAQA